MFVFANDKERLWKHFRRDPVLFAYHIGDLDDFFFSQCQWAASYATRRHPIIEDVILIFFGSEIPSVLAFGIGEEFEQLLAETLDVLPERFFCHFQESSRAIFRTRFAEQPFGTHRKMQLVKLKPAPPNEMGAKIQHLDTSHAQELTGFYSRAYPDGYFIPRLLEMGKFVGAFVDGKLVSVAGVHVASDQYKVAALGNIATDPEFRGRKLARLLTHELARQFKSEGKLICLNVKDNNAAAIRCYEQVGFEIRHSYEEARFEANSPRQ